jgi:chromatin segregation and condensation protein Rec8/ScpA/Scc1 (kleisin family)
MDDETWVDPTEMGEVNEEETTLDEEEETIESLHAKLDEERAAREKAEKIAEDRKVRAEMAEKEAKKASKPVPAPKKTGELSTMDAITLMKANVDEDDIEEITNYANYKGISIREALKDNVVKSMISDRTEQRKTAEATNTGSSRRTTNKVSDDSLMQNAKAGRMPESDSDIERLAEAHLMASVKPRG